VNREILRSSDREVEGVGSLPEGEQFSQVLSAQYAFHTRNLQSRLAQEVVWLRAGQFNGL
jgi:hypothetical protein